MDVVADFELWESSRAFRLPGTGTRSMLFRFDDLDGEPLVGAIATSADGTDFAPGRSFTDVRLEFWTDEARAVASAGGRVTVWYGGDIGKGVVRPR